MAKSKIGINEFWNFFLRGRVYLIRRVEEDWVTISRLRRHRNGLKVSSFMFTRKLGIPGKGVYAKTDDLVYKGYSQKWRLLKMLVKKQKINPAEVAKE